MTKRLKSVSEILCVHQGFELFGSDRSFIRSLNAIRSNLENSKIKILLPKSGELSERLQTENYDVRIASIWIARKANGVLGNLTQLFKLPMSIISARRNINQSALTYINTSVVFDYILASRFAKTPVVIHVREIPTGFARRILRAVMLFSRGTIIFNSQATMQAFELPADRKQVVIYNGSSIPNINSPRAAFSSPTNEVRILVVGRINKWKGQDLLIQAVSSLPEEMRNRVRVRIAGTAFEGTDDFTVLQDMVERSPVRTTTEFMGFVADPTDLYQWSDIVVVPSKKPEPFGLVAIEAMGHQRVVVAAAHGGLKEIVIDQQTGLLFVPGSQLDLAAKIEELISNPTYAQNLAEQGHKRFRDSFSEQTYKDNIAKCLLQQAEASTIPAR
ncbi:glycosyltransferase family 4 protein [Devosia submarina]|uniref:glycosyltransferase family 4 protein n=1 Tax=Devosia submarina TaxID=1173082 RepID=UPI0013002C45|nr:glycosyltransferase family 4 protein [Devosia submarina]